MFMEKNIKVVTDSIIETIYKSQSNSFEENPTLAYNILLSIVEQMEDFKYTDFSSRIQNRWKKLTSLTSMDKFELSQKVEEVIQLYLKIIELAPEQMESFPHRHKLPR